MNTMKHRMQNGLSAVLDQTLEIVMEDDEVESHSPSPGSPSSQPSPIPASTKQQCHMFSEGRDAKIEAKVHQV